MPASALGRRLAQVGMACFGALLPILMVVANKSAPATLGAAALLINLAVIVSGGGAALATRYRRLLTRPASLVGLSLVALCVASLVWTVDPAFTRRGLVEGLPELVFAVAAAAAWPLVARRNDIHWLALGIVGAAVLIAFERASGMVLHELVRARAEAWDLKRSAIPPVLLLWPALDYYLARRRLWWIAAGLVLAAGAGLVLAHSGAPGLGLLLGIVAVAASRLAPRTSLVAVTVALLVLCAAAPFTGTLAHRLLPASAEQALSEEHASHRMQIWTAFERRIADRPWLGHGFNASFGLWSAPRPGGLAPEPDNDMLFEKHPHDVLLQLWVELGLVGALASAAALVGLAVRIGRRPAPQQAGRLGLLACTIGVGLVGLSAWQPWWLATIAVALLWFEPRQEPSA